MRSLPVAIAGRPDFADPDFGKTYLKKFPPYVYSVLGGMLVHKVRAVEAQWYEPTTLGQGDPGGALARLASPRLTILTVCGMMFYAGSHLKAKRAQACELPKPDAVLCGRCHGTGAVFGKGLAEKKVSRRSARRRIGCVVEVA